MPVVSVGSVRVGAALRAVIDVAEDSLDVTVCEDRLLVTAVNGVSMVLGDGCTVWVEPTVSTDPPSQASSHPDAVQEALDHVIAAAASTTRRFTADEPSGGWLREHGLQQCVIAPILVRSQAIGSLVVTRAEGRRPLDDNDLEFVAAMADVVGITAQATRMRNDAMTTMEDLRQQVAVTDNISDALITCDSSYLIVGWNTGAEAIYGYTRDEAIGCHMATLLASEYMSADGTRMTAEETRTSLMEVGEWRGEVRERRADGEQLTLLASVTQLLDSRRRHSGVVVVNRDVTAQRREEYQAMHDPLTGLPNRRMLSTRLYEAVARASRSGLAMAVLFIDLDGFKPINDTYGHAAGDTVLTTTARRLAAAVRHRDTVGRLGGDEFLVILEEAGRSDDIAGAVERITAALAEPIGVEGAVVTVLPSIGVCMWETPDEAGIPAEHLLELSDQAMYVAKREQRGSYFVTVGEPAVTLSGPSAPPSMTQRGAGTPASSS